MLRFIPHFLCFALLSACAQVGIVPDTFNKKLAIGYATVQTVAESAAFAYAAGKLSDADKNNVVTTSKAAITGLDLAQTIYAGVCPKTAPQPCAAPAADAKLQATLAILTALQAYLATQGAKS